MAACEPCLLLECKHGRVLTIGPQSQLVVVPLTPDLLEDPSQLVFDLATHSTQLDRGSLGHSLIQPANSVHPQVPLPTTIFSSHTGSVRFDSSLSESQEAEVPGISHELTFSSRGARWQLVGLGSRRHLVLLNKRALTATCDALPRAAKEEPSASNHDYYYDDPHDGDDYIFPHPFYDSTRFDQRHFAGPRPEAAEDWLEGSESAGEEREAQVGLQAALHDSDRESQSYDDTDEEASLSDVETSDEDGLRRRGVEEHEEAALTESLCVLARAPSPRDDVPPEQQWLVIPLSLLTSGADWMGSYPRLSRLYLNEVFIPGTHDSATSSIGPASPLAPDAPPFLRARPALFALVRGIFASWSRTQTTTVHQQLHHGIRYFDLRVGYEQGAFTLVHGLVAGPLSAVLQDFAAFHAAHPKEVLLLDFNHFYGLGAQEHSALLATLSATLGHALYPSPLPHAKLPTVGDLWTAKRPIVIFYCHDFMSPPRFIWNGHRVASPWPNVTSVNRLLSYLRRNLPQPHPNRLHVSQGVLTPTSGTVVSGSLLCWRAHSLEEFAAPAAAPVLGWALRTGLRGRLNVVIVDFVANTPLVAIAILVNAFLVARARSTRPRRAVANTAENAADQHSGEKHRREKLRREKHGVRTADAHHGDAANGKANDASSGGNRRGTKSDRKRRGKRKRDRRKSGRSVARGSESDGSPRATEAGLNSLAPSALFTGASADLLTGANSELESEESPVHDGAPAGPEFSTDLEDEPIHPHSLDPARDTPSDVRAPFERET